MTTNFHVDNLIVSTINGGAPLSDPTTTKGDLIVNSGAGLARLPVGANTYVLTASTSAPNGVAWIPATGGGGGSQIIDARITFGAIVDGNSAGGTDNLSEMTAGLAVLNDGTPYIETFIQNEGLDVNVSASVPNVYGSLIGPGRLIQTGDFPTPYPGRVQLNSRADVEGGRVCGQEYLYAFQNKMQLRAGCEIRFMGDSTTAGDSLAHSYDTIDILTQQVIADHGFACSVFNAGHSGIDTQQWVTTYLAGDISSNPDMMVIRYGINDPGWKKDGSVGTLNAYEAEYASRRDIGDFITSMRSGLATIRAAHDVTELSIILMVPNSTSDSPNGRDEKWYELVRYALRQAARDYQCAFIDTYAYWRDSRNAAGRWMDNAALPAPDGRAIHPLDIMNQWIASVIGDLVVPSGIELRNVYAVRSVSNAANTPSEYPIGNSSYSVVSVSAGADTITGCFETFRSADGVLLQFLVDETGVAPLYYRFGVTGTDTWFSWVAASAGGTGTTQVSLTALNGWVDSGPDVWTMHAQKTGSMVTLSGRVKSGSTTSASQIAALPAGYQPVKDAYYPVMCGPSLSTMGSLIVSTSGFLLINNVPSNAYLDIGPITFPTI